MSSGRLFVILQPYLILLLYSSCRRVVSCGVLQTPRFGRKLSFDFMPGAKVAFECNEGFILVGDQRRECLSNGLWNLPEYGYTECLREYYQSRVYIANICLPNFSLLLFLLLLLF